MSTLTVTSTLLTNLAQATRDRDDLSAMTVRVCALLPWTSHLNRRERTQLARELARLLHPRSGPRRDSDVTIALHGWRSTARAHADGLA